MSASRPAYLEHTHYRDPVDEKKLAFLVAELERVGQAPLDILEVGCGSGNICRPLASLGHNVRATDIDPASVAYARRQNHFPNLTLEIGGIESLAEEKPQGYDAVIASEVLEHIEGPAAALAKIRRLLRPGGIVLVTIPNGYGPWEAGQAVSPRRLAGWLARRSGLYGPMKRLLGVKPLAEGGVTSTFNYESPHLQHFTLKSFTAMAESAGYSIERRMHSDGPLTFFSGIRGIRPLARLDCSIVDRLPPGLASGWYFALRPIEATPR
jgi:SAM-dependent methyltransferase